MSANGRDIITEIREPLGRGIDHAREAVAILGVSFRVRIQPDALKGIFCERRVTSGQRCGRGGNVWC
jgi:hypothetical protein